MQLMIRSAVLLYQNILMTEAMISPSTPMPQKAPREERSFFVVYPKSPMAPKVRLAEQKALAITGES